MSSATPNSRAKNPAWLPRKYQVPFEGRKTETSARASPSKSYKVLTKVEAAVWLTVKVCPPAVIVPALAGPVFACTEKEIVALPEPLVLFKVIQGKLLTAVQ